MDLKKTSALFGVMILVVAILLQTFPKSLLALDYQLNTDIFAAYCVNKDKPAMHCNGHCVFEKKMKDMDQQQGDSQAQEKPITVVYTMPEMLVVNLVEKIQIRAKISHFYNENLTPKQFPINIFHPPENRLS